MHIDLPPPPHTTQRRATSIRTGSAFSSTNPSTTHTPTHGGTVAAGGEYDMPIAQPPDMGGHAPSTHNHNHNENEGGRDTMSKGRMPGEFDSGAGGAAQVLMHTPQPVSTVTSTSNTSAAPVSRSTSRSGSHRVRPVSMPPQALNAASVVSGDESSSRRTPATPTPTSAGGTTSTTGRSGRSSHRILGDYTLSKTLGAGSMGKVKLGTHNISGEKVCYWSFCLLSS